MCNRDLENLKRWKPDEYLAIQRAEVLTPQGVEDMKLLAGRLQRNFPQLLHSSSEHITAENYTVCISHDRVKQSGVNFVLRKSRRIHYSLKQPMREKAALAGS